MTTSIGFPPTLIRGQQINKSHHYSEGYRNSSSKSPESRHQVSSTVSGVVNNLISPKIERSPPPRINDVDKKPSTIIEGKFEHLPWHMIAVGVLLEEDEDDDDLYNNFNDSNSTISIAADANDLLGPNIEWYAPDRSLYQQQQRQQQQQQNMLLPPLPKYQQQSKHKQTSPTTSPLRQQQRQQQQKQQQQRMVTDNNISMASSSNTAASSSSSSPPSDVHIASTIVPSSNSPLPRYQPEQHNRRHHHNQQQQPSVLPPLPKYQPQPPRTGTKISLPPTSMKQKQQKKKMKMGGGGGKSVVSSSSSVMDDDSIIAPTSSVAGNNEAATRKSHRSVASSTATSSSSSAYSSEDLQNKLFEFTNIIELKDNRYRMKRYKNTFVGSEAVDALIKHNVVSTRTDAVILGRRLAKKYNLFKHVCDDHLFKDENLFYRYNTK